VEATISKDENVQVATLTPTSDLEKGKTYKVTVSKKVKDKMGNNMASDEIWLFQR
jgi:hypothetical protein